MQATVAIVERLRTGHRSVLTVKLRGVRPFLRLHCLRPRVTRRDVESFKQNEKMNPETINNIPVVPSTYKLRTEDDPVLKTVCRPVRDGEPVARLIDALKMNCRRYKGAGLAASQLGDLRRVIWLRPDSTTPGFIMINPHIVASSPATGKGIEGCLSFPGRVVQVQRSESVTVKYLTEQRVEKTQTLANHAARVFFHENDHLNGVCVVSEDTGAMTKNKAEVANAVIGPMDGMLLKQELS